MKAQSPRIRGCLPAMLDKGIYLAPAQFEAVFLSAAHTKKQLDDTLEAAEDYFQSKSKPVS